MTTTPAPSPFLPPGRSRKRLGGILGFGLVLAAATVATWLLTRKRAPELPPDHQHAAAASSDSARRVMISAEAARRIGVTYAPVQRGPLGRVVRTVAVVGYDETRLKTISARVDGWVDQLYVNFTGQAVRVGQPLFSLYSPMLVSAQQELLLARRLRGEVAGGTSDAVAGTGDLLESARRRLLYWEVPAEEIRRIEESGEVRKAITFRSPTHGVVIEKSVLAGQRIMAGETIYRVADLRVIWLEGEIFERDLPAVRLGLLVTAEFPALPGEPRTGRITYIYPTLNVETRTARVRVELSNPSLDLKPGMYATFTFASRTDPVLSVPRGAVLSTGKRDLVFVRLSGGMLEPRDVQLGLATDERIEIRSGLSQADTVVASATFLVDAESNLSSLLGGMGSMPGMDLTAPSPGSPAPASPSRPNPRPRSPTDSVRMKMPEAPDSHRSHAMPPGS